MALGQLGPDASRFVALVAAGTGLDPIVVRAWVGEETGWGVEKATHNYLNIGPGRAYPSADVAAAAVAKLVNESSSYAGIRAAKAVGPSAQVTAIGASPWGTIAPNITAVYRSLSAAPQATKAGWSVDLPNLPDLPGRLPDLPNLPKIDPGGAAGSIGSAVTGDVAGAITKGVQALGVQALRIGLSLIFTVGGLALIGLGLARLTGRDARDMFAAANEVKGTAEQAAGMAAMAL